MRNEVNYILDYLLYHTVKRKTDRLFYILRTFCLCIQKVTNRKLLDKQKEYAYNDYMSKFSQKEVKKLPKSYSEQEREYISKRLKEEAAKCLARYGVRRTTVDEIVEEHFQDDTDTIEKMLSLFPVKKEVYQCCIPCNLFCNAA